MNNNNNRGDISYEAKKAREENCALSKQKELDTKKDT